MISAVETTGAPRGGSLLATANIKSVSSWRADSRVHPAVHRRNVHWRVPYIMGSSYAVGVVCAFAHHAFYSIMNGKVVTSNLEQQITTSVGTALAFLVKTPLVIAVGVAYTQQMWFSLQAEPAQIISMDSMFGVLGNAWEFLDVMFWLSRPLLAFTAALTWLLPLAAIFTPASLSIQPKLFANSSIINVPQRDYSKSSAFQFNAVSANETIFVDGSISLTRSSGIVLTQGAMLPVSNTPKNLTYKLYFDGPAVQCAEPENATTNGILQALENYQQNSTNLVYWMSWAPDENSGEIPNATFIGNFANALGTLPGVDFISKDAAKVFHVLYFPSSFEKVGQNTEIPETGGQGTTRVLACSLYNASYEVLFKLHSNGEEEIIANRTLNHAVPLVPVIDANVSDYRVTEQFSYAGIMQTYGNLVTGQTLIPSGNFSEGSEGTGTITANPLLGPILLGSEHNLSIDQLGSALEAIFQNMTLTFRYSQIPISGHDTIATDIGNGNTDADGVFASIASTYATSLESRNAFSYAPRQLLIPYGIAILLSSFCLAIGVAAIYNNGVSYSNNFSTILRMTRHDCFDALIGEEDRGGADPLPFEVAEAAVGFRTGLESVREKQGRQIGVILVDPS